MLGVYGMCLDSELGILVFFVNVYKDFILFFYYKIMKL